LAEFYERAGVAESLNNSTGSITVIGAVSPAGGDFSEPVTQNTLRIVKVFWALDAKLSQRRHFPAINWLNSYTLYMDTLSPWYTENVAPDWNELRGKSMEILQLESELLEIVQLVGSDALPESQQISMESARMIREIFLQQNSFHPVDTYCSFDKQYKLLKSIMRWNELAEKYLAEGAPIKNLVAMDSKAELAKIRYEENFDQLLVDVMNKMEAEFTQIGSGGY